MLLFRKVQGIYNVGKYILLQYVIIWIYIYIYIVMILTTYRIPINYLLPTPDKSNPNRIATAIIFLFIGAPMHIYDVEMYVSYR